MTYWIHYITNEGRPDKILLSTYDNPEYMKSKISTILYIEDVPEINESITNIKSRIRDLLISKSPGINESITQINLLLHKLEQ